MSKNTRQREFSWARTHTHRQMPRQNWPKKQEKSVKFFNGIVKYIMQSRRILLRLLFLQTQWRTTTSKCRALFDRFMYIKMYRRCSVQTTMHRRWLAAVYPVPLEPCTFVHSFIAENCLSVWVAMRIHKNWQANKEKPEKKSSTRQPQFTCASGKCSHREKRLISIRSEQEEAVKNRAWSNCVGKWWGRRTSELVRFLCVRRLR